MPKRPRSRAASRVAGFTLIEVMVAVVILAVGLASLFTSEAGAIRIAQRARTTTIATLLARCKMGEVEERVSKEGFPAERIDGRDECCEGGEHDGFKCEWKVERIVLPEIDAEGGGDGGMKLPGTPGGKDEKGSPLAPGAGPSTGSSSRPLPNALSSLSGDAGVSPEGGILGNVMTSLGESSGGGGDPIAAMVMEMTFPTMKPVIEEGVRRATVTISWKEGDKEQSFDLVQYLVNEAPIVLNEEGVETLQATGGTTAGTTAGAGGATTGGTKGSTVTPAPRTPTPGAGGRP